MGWERGGSTKGDEMVLIVHVFVCLVFLLGSTDVTGCGC